MASMNPDNRFTEELREQAEPTWSDATQHRFVEELGDGSIDDEVFARYLIQDYAFVNTLVSTFAYAAGDAPSIDEKRQLIEFLDTVTSDENDYFERSFEALGVGEEEYREPELADVTKEFNDLLMRAAREGGYAETLAVLVPAEWIYLTWATNLKQNSKEPDSFYLSEWIELHANPGFEEFVGWLRSELDSEYEKASEERRKKIDYFFRRTVEMEREFFDSAYS